MCALNQSQAVEQDRRRSYLRNTPRKERSCKPAKDALEKRPLPCPFSFLINQSNTNQSNVNYLVKSSLQKPGKRWGFGRLSPPAILPAHPHSAIAFAVFSGSIGSGGAGVLAVLTAQNLQPLVQVSPSSMIVAVALWCFESPPAPPPPFQHSPMLGHWASSHT